ncbi:MAG: sugar phosphate isomerase/epimerase family protein [Candidatus Brocadiia bacterium]
MYPAFNGSAIGVSLPFEEAVEQAAHHGFEGIYLDLGYLSNTGPETVVQMLSERSLRTAGWYLPFGLTTGEAAFESGLQSLPATAEACARAGAARCSTWIPPGSDELTRDAMFEQVRDRARAVAEVLAEHDTRLGLEFIGPKTSRARRRHEFIHTMDGMIELCEAVGTGNVGLLLDCWHLYTSGGSMDDVLKLSDGQLVDVHINDAPEGVPLEEHVDNVRRLPGETGVIDCARFLECLDQIGYSGPVMAEPLSRPADAQTDQEAIRVAKEAIDSVWPG